MADQKESSLARFSHWLAIFANLAVVGGIIFLGIEIRQNNELLEVQTQADLFDRVSNFPEEIIRTPELATALSKVETGEQLTQHDELVLRAMALKSFRLLEWQYREMQAGRIEAMDLTLWRAGFRNEGVFRWPLGRYWSDMKQFMRADFVEFVDENIVDQ